MLSNIGRAAIRRVGGSTQSTNRALRYLWHLHRATPTQNLETSSTQLQSASSRSYATATTDASTAKAKPVAKAASKTAAKTKTKAKPAVKKAAKKPLKKKKAVAKKAKPKAKKRKPLSEEDKAKRELKLLKEKALLKGPKQKPSTAWAVFASEIMTNRPAGTPITQVFKLASTRYKALTAQDLEHYNQIANQNKAANESSLKEWLASYTPAEINTANNARALLQRKYTAPGARVSSIKDPRIPKRPTPARLLFTKDKYASGDLKGISIVEANALINKEWDVLPASEKKSYQDAEQADRQRYARDYKVAYGRESPSAI